MKQTRMIFFILLCGLFLSSCSEQSIKGSGKIVDQARQLAAFDRIQVDGSLALIISLNQPQSMNIIADDNLHPYILTEVSRGLLRIYTKRHYSLVPSETMRVYVNLMKLKNLIANGSIQAKVIGIGNPSFNLQSNGSNQIILIGKTQKNTIGVRGEGVIDAHNLEAKRTDLDVKGAAKVSLYASQKLNVKISGAGKVVYYGKPAVINKTVFGNGMVEDAEKR